MNIWIVTIGEHLPIDGDNPRLHRSGLFSEFLVKNGHSVTWWTNDFNHFTKKHRGYANEAIKVKENLTIFLLNSKGYEKNLSLSRLMDHYELGKAFKAYSANYAPPDIILTSYPSIYLSKACLIYGKTHKLPVIVDLRDLWPESFLDVFPKKLHFLAKIPLFPMIYQAKYVFKHADSLTSISRPFLDRALKKANRVYNDNKDKVFPFGYERIVSSSAYLEEGKKFFLSLGIDLDEKKNRICFIGTIGHQFDLDTVIEAAQKVATENVEFVLCGKGEMLDHYKETCKRLGLTNVKFTGYINKNQIKLLMENSVIGLAPYIFVPNFLDNMPNKIIEYLSEGLIILTSLYGGHINDFLTQHKVGFSYQPHDSEMLAQLIRKAFQDSAKSEEMKKNALTIFDTLFQANIVYNNYMNHLVKTVEDYKIKLT
jgi:glycosyltransferase involved in cell wall biosynthesis